MIKKIIKNQEGLTLIEMMVSVGIFSVVVLAATGILNSVLRGQMTAVASQNVQESMRYALEVMSKEMRTAPERISGCLDGYNPPKIVYNTYNADKMLYFTNKDGECVLYFLNNNRIMIMRDLDVDYITPEKIEVTDLKFAVMDDNIGAFHSVQPLVMMSMDVKAASALFLDKKTRIETTISSRYYR